MHTVTVPFVPLNLKPDQPFRTTATGANAASEKLAKQAAASEAMLDLVLHRLVLADGKRPRAVVAVPEIQAMFTK